MDRGTNAVKAASPKWLDVLALEIRLLDLYKTILSDWAKFVAHRRIKHD